MLRVGMYLLTMRGWTIVVCELPCRVDLGWTDVVWSLGGFGCEIGFDDWSVRTGFVGRSWSFMNLVIAALLHCISALI